MVLPDTASLRCRRRAPRRRRRAAPAGFVAAGVAAGIKRSGRLDLGILVFRERAVCLGGDLHRQRRRRRAGSPDPGNQRL